MGKFFKAAATVLTLLIIGGMAVIIYVLTLPGSLPEIEGREDILAGKIRKEKVFDRMKLAFNSQKDFVVSEEQINHYIASQLKVSQGGKLQQNVSVKGVWVNFSADNVTLFLEREVEVGGGEDENGKKKQPYKQAHITKINFEIKTVEHADMSIEKTTAPGGGQVGGIPTPGLFNALAKSPFDKVAEAFPEELKMFRKMREVRIKDGKITMSSAVNTIVKPAPSSSSKK